MKSPTLLLRAKALIRQLANEVNLAIECPSCGRKIPSSNAELFTEENMSPRAVAYRKEREDAIEGLKQQIDDLKHKKEDRLERTTQAVNIGKIIERFAPVLSGFGYDPRDCRALFEPIDYVVFHGAHAGKITHVDIVEVKSGGARLNPVERQIRDLVTQGQVDFQVMETSQ